MAPEPRYPLVAYLKLEKAYVDQLNRLLQKAAIELSREIAALKTGRNPLTRAQLEAQRAAIIAHLNRDFGSIDAIIRNGQKAAAEGASRVLSRYENLLLDQVMTRSDMDLIAAAEANRAASSIQTTIARFSSSNRNLSSKVYSTKSLTNGWVDELINLSLLKGQSAAQLAAAVKQFISPNTPGGASYAAKRLARTEINNAFHAASVDRYQRSGLVEEVDWHLSSSHPEGDICDSYAADGPYPVNAVPEKPHPLCFCFTTASLPSRSQFIDNLFAGKYGDEPWIDKVQLPD